MSNPSLEQDLSALRDRLTRLGKEAESVLKRHKSATQLHTVLRKFEEAMRAMGELTGPVEASQVDWDIFAGALRVRRLAAGLSQKEVAALVGASPSYVRAWEAGARKPSVSTLMRLLSVRALGLTMEDLAKPSTNGYRTLLLAPEYQPTEMLADLCTKLAGSGCSLEQTFAYLDTQSASDYLALANQPSYAITEGAKKTSLEQIAAQVASGMEAEWLDVVVLGCGDAKRECDLVQSLVTHAKEKFRVRLILIDISHALLTEGYKNACALLLNSVEILALQGNFHEIAQYAILTDVKSSRRARLFTMLGNTLANLDNETRFFRDNLAGGASVGDYFLLDYTSAFAAPENADEIRRLDPAVGTVRESHTKFLSGIFYRYCSGLKSVEIGIELNTDCVVKGSYELAYVATVHLNQSRLSKRFVVFRIRRYDGDLLAESLNRAGWTSIDRLTYGEKGSNKLQLILLQRKQDDPSRLRARLQP